MGNFYRAKMTVFVPFTLRHCEERRDDAIQTFFQTTENTEGAEFLSSPEFRDEFQGDPLHMAGFP